MRKPSGSNLALAAAAAVATLSVITGSVYAILTDSFVFENNNAESSLLLATDIKVALNPAVSPCDATSLAYVDGPAVGALSVDFDLTPGFRRNAALPGAGQGNPYINGGGTAVGESFDMCVANLSHEAILLRISASVDTSVESERCLASEVQAGDATCDKGDPGEIGETQLWFAVSLSTSNSCLGTAPSPFRSGGSGATLANAMPAGARCSMRLTPYLRFADDDSLLRAQTDTVSFDVRLDGSWAE